MRAHASEWPRLILVSNISPELFGVLTSYRYLISRWGFRTHNLYIASPLYLAAHLVPGSVFEDRRMLAIAPHAMYTLVRSRVYKCRPLGISVSSARTGINNLTVCRRNVTNNTHTPSLAMVRRCVHRSRIHPTQTLVGAWPWRTTSALGVGGGGSSTTSDGWCHSSSTVGREKLFSGHGSRLAWPRGDFMFLGFLVRRGVLR